MTKRWPILLTALLVAAGCGNGDEVSRQAAEPGLTPFELEHGIGPVTEEVTLPGAMDQDLAREGEQLFQFNCEACHRMEERFVGPPLGDVLDRRSPTFILNMILNPEEMAREHPEGQKLLAEYPLIMPFQNISEDEARAILEYLRTR